MNNNTLQNTKERIPYKDSFEKWELSVTLSGGIVPLTQVVHKIARIAEKFGFICDICTNLNLLVYKNITFKIYGESTKKYAYKLKSELADFLHTL